MTQVSTSTALVVEQANELNPNNKAVAVSQWSRFGRVIEVKPNHKYTFTYDYYLQNGAKLGDFNIYNVSSVNNNTYIGRDDIYEAGITVTENNTFLFRDSENNKFPELGNNYFRGADKAADYTDAAGNPVDSHETWITRTATFTTDANTTKILIAWKPEGDKPLILDNFNLTGLFVPDVDVTITGADDPTSASAYAVVNDAKTEIKFVAKNFPNSEFLGWYRNGQLVSTNAIYTESFNGDAATNQKMEARFNCKYFNEFNDGFGDTLETNSSITMGQSGDKLAEEEYTAGKWRYNRKTTPNANGWMTADGSKDVLVTELTDANGDINKVIKVEAWTKLAKVIEVKPSHKYTFTFDYYAPNGAEFGHFNILNVSSVTNNSYVGVWDINCPYDSASLKKQYAWFDTEYNTFAEMGNSYFKSSSKQDNGVPGEEGYIDSHETWITKTFTFETDANTTKILLTWNPESNVQPVQPLYLDNFVLTSEFNPSVTVVTTGADTANAGGASAKLNDTKDGIIYSAYTYANGEFLGWFRNDNLVSTKLSFTENFDGNVDTYVTLEARFNCLFKNEFTGDSGFEATSVGTDVTQGAFSADQNNLKHRIVVGYKAAKTDGSAKAGIALQTLLDNGFNAKKIIKSISNENYIVVAVSPADDATKTAALQLLSTVQSDIPSEYFASNDANDKIILGYLRSGSSVQQTKARIAVENLLVAGIDSKVVTVEFDNKTYYAVELTTNDATAKQAAIDALSDTFCELPDVYDE